MSIDRYVGRVVNIVYIDRKNRITQRSIEIKAVTDGQIERTPHTLAPKETPRIPSKPESNFV